MNQSRTGWLPIVALTAGMVLWASSFPVMKLTFQALDPMVVICGRMVVGSLCFLILYKKVFPVDYQAGDWKYILLMALCEPCMYFIFEAWALTKTTASQAGMITAILPLLVAVAARFILKEQITARTTAGFALAIGGAFWLSAASQASEGAPNPILGNFLEFLAMCFATGYIVTLKKLSSRYPPFFLTAMQSFIGAVFFFPIMFLPPTRLPTTFDAAAWGGVLYLGAFVTLGAYGLYNYGVSKIPASQASAFVNLIPVFTVLLGWIILGETFNFWQYIASCLVLAGVFVTQEHAFSVKGFKGYIRRVNAVFNVRNH